jgi:hypothetical protein
LLSAAVLFETILEAQDSGLERLAVHLFICYVLTQTIGGNVYFSEVHTFSKRVVCEFPLLINLCSFAKIRKLVSVKLIELCLDRQRHAIYYIEKCFI